MSQQELDHQGVVPCQPITRRQRETCLAVPNTGLEPGPPVDASPVPETLPEHVAGDPDEPSRDRGDGLESGVRPRPQCRFCSSDGGIDLASAPLTSWLGTGPDFLSSLLSDGGGPWAPPRSGGTMRSTRTPQIRLFMSSIKTVSLGPSLGASLPVPDLPGSTGRRGGLRHMVQETRPELHSFEAPGETEDLLDADLDQS
jgi:hypothetical protein